MIETFIANISIINLHKNNLELMPLIKPLLLFKLNYIKKLHLSIGFVILEMSLLLPLKKNNLNLKIWVNSQLISFLTPNIIETTASQ